MKLRVPPSLNAAATRKENGIGNLIYGKIHHESLNSGVSDASGYACVLRCWRRKSFGLGALHTSIFSHSFFCAHTMMAGVPRELPLTDASIGSRAAHFC
jgi:hypothetical protein